MAFSGEKLRHLRMLKGKSQRDLPVGHDTISALESGRRHPHPSTLRKLADALGVEVSDFFETPAGPSAAALPEDFDVVGITREVEAEHSEIPKDSPEFRELVDERLASELEHLSKTELKAIKADLQTKSRSLDKSFGSPLWSDPKQYDAWLRQWDERRAVQLALFALDRVLADA